MSPSKSSRPIAFVVAALVAATSTVAWFVLADEPASSSVSFPSTPSRIETHETEGRADADAFGIAPSGGSLRTATAAELEADEPTPAPRVAPTNASVVVRVVDAEGRPIRDAQVRAFERVSTNEPSATSTSEVDGSATLALAAGASYRIDARAELGTGVVWGALEPVSAGAEVRLVLRSTVTLRGRVLDQASANPIDGAIVVLESGPHSESTRTAANGEFAFTELTLDPVRLEVLAAEHERLRVTLVPGIDPVDLELRAGAPIHGVVVDADTNAAIAAARVVVAAQRKVDGSTLRVTLDGVDTGADGAFVVRSSCTDGVVLRASAPGYADGAIELDDDVSHSGLRVPLKRARELRGTARLADGSPARAARVVLLGLEHHQASTRKMRAGDDGAFVVEGIDPDATFRVLVAHESASPVVVDAALFPRDRARDVVLPERNRLTVVFTTASGEPWSQARIALEADAPALAKAAKVELVAWTDATGQCAFEGLPAGTYRLRGQSADAALEAIEVTLAEGESKSIRASARGAAWIEGIAIDERSSPLPHATIRVVERVSANDAQDDTEDRMLAEVLAGTDGRFRALVAAHDASTLFVVGSADGHAESELGPTAAPAADLVLVLPTLGRCRGRVVDALTRRPITAFSLRLDGDDDTTIKQSLHANDGTFAIDELGLGSMEITLRADGYRTLGPQSIEITSDATPLEFALTPCAEIQGRLVTAAGIGCGGLRVGLMQGDRVLQSAHARQDGAFRMRDLEPGRCTLIVGDAAAPLLRLDDVELRAGVVDVGALVLTLDGALTVRVVRGGEAVADVAVRVEGFATKSVLKLASDANGSANAAPLPADHYRVKVEGHVTEVDVRAGARSEIVVTLPEESA